MKDMNDYKSIVLGFCKCNRCKQESFVWNSYFICKNCGFKEYTKSDFFVEENGKSEKIKGEH